MSLHEPTSAAFKANSVAALANVNLQSALRTSRGGFVDKRQTAIEAVPEFEALREQAKALKDHVLANLGHYLEQYEVKVIAAGGHVHWAETAEDAQKIVLDLCRKAGAKAVNKGKTMISEECGINDFLAANGITPAAGLCSLTGLSWSRMMMSRAARISERCGMLARSTRISGLR